jgi:hypothetical protein
MSDSPQKLAEDYLADLDRAIEEYRLRNTHGGTLIVSSDAARELLPGYSSPVERLRNNYALGPASSRLVAAVWDDAILRGPGPAKPGLEFLTGCPGSGKTQSLAGPEELPYGIVSEAMMDNFQLSAVRIQQAQAAGFKPVLRLVYADDPRTNLRRAVLRAMEFGRPVRIPQMARLYVQIPRTVYDLAAHFNRQVGLFVVQNSEDGLPARKSTLQEALALTGAYTVSAAMEAMTYELEELCRVGEASPEVAHAFRDQLG